MFVNVVTNTIGPPGRPSLMYVIMLPLVEPCWRPHTSKYICIVFYDSRQIRRTTLVRPSSPTATASTIILATLRVAVVNAGFSGLIEQRETLFELSLSRQLATKWWTQAYGRETNY